MCRHGHVNASKRVDVIDVRTKCRWVLDLLHCNITANRLKAVAPMTSVQAQHDLFMVNSLIGSKGISAGSHSDELKLDEQGGL